MTQEQKGPLIKREITLGDIVSLCVAIAAVFVAYGKLDSRVTVVETAQAYQTKTNDTFQKDVKDTLKDIAVKLSEMSDRLPRK